jgi:hypothetical protein
VFCMQSIGARAPSNSGGLKQFVCCHVLKVKQSLYNSFSQF